MTDGKNRKSEAPPSAPADSEREALEREARAHDAAIAQDENKVVDAGSEYSFPASDPPSYMGGAAVAGPPPRRRHREGVSTEFADPEAAMPEHPPAPGVKKHRQAPARETKREKKT
jgi:hypothetical protein